MDNKILVHLIVPELNQSYDVYLPINKKMGNIISLLNKAVNELSGGDYPLSSSNKLYHAITKELYQSDILLAHTDIQNGTKLVLLS